MAIAQVQVLHAVLQSGIRWRVTLYCDSAAGALVRFEKTGKGGRLLHQQLARWSPLDGAGSRIGPGPLRGSLTPPRPDACVLHCALHGPFAPIPPLLSPVAWLPGACGSEQLLLFPLAARLGELVDQILFERQPAQAPLPLDPEILALLPY